MDDMDGFVIASFYFEVMITEWSLHKEVMDLSGGAPNLGFYHDPFFVELWLS